MREKSRCALCLFEYCYRSISSFVRPLCSSWLLTRWNENQIRAQTLSEIRFSQPLTSLASSHSLFPSRFPFLPNPEHFVHVGMYMDKGSRINKSQNWNRGVEFTSSGLQRLRIAPMRLKRAERRKAILDYRNARQDARTSARSIDASAWMFRIKAESLSCEFASMWRNFAYARL
jgi:hypothetical protein